MSEKTTICKDCQHADQRGGEWYCTAAPRAKETDYVTGETAYVGGGDIPVHLCRHVNTAGRCAQYVERVNPHEYRYIKFQFMEQSDGFADVRISFYTNLLSLLNTDEIPRGVVEDALWDVDPLITYKPLKCGRMFTGISPEDMGSVCAYILLHTA